MPLMSLVLIRTALLQFGLGFALGGLVLAAKGGLLPAELWLLRTAHIHMLLIGWMVQFACGVAYWILPRLDARGERGPVLPFWLGYGMLNGGVLLAAFAQPFAGLLYIGAALALVPALWRRVLPFRNLPRE